MILVKKPAKPLPVLRPKLCTETSQMKVSHFNELVLCLPVARELYRREIAQR